MAILTSSSRHYVPSLSRHYHRLEVFAYPLVRFVTGFFLVPHGAQKLFGFFGGSAAQSAAFFSKIGLEPALPLVYIVGIIEFFGGLCIAFGFLTRPAAVAAAIMLAVATFYVHFSNGFFWNKGGFEYPMMWMILCIAVAIRGGGSLSVDRAMRREF